jgi:radical SAM protein (TIGR01212 family)
VPIELPLAEQLRQSKAYLVRKFRAEKFLAYFQAYSNTYATAQELEPLYASVLSDPEVVGLIIGTRPDCLPDDVLDMIAAFARKTYLWLEIGMQSMHDRTLARINRGHDHACSADAIKRAKQRGILVCAHLIIGLPGETREEMLASVNELNRLGVDGVKIHHLHVLKGSRLAEEYMVGVLPLLGRDEYVQLVCDAVERLDERILIHRLMGDGRTELLAPDWSRRKLEVLNMIDAEFAKRGSRQGSRLPR